MSNTALPTLTRFGNGFSEKSEKVQISVIVPVYKVRPYFPDLLESLAAQDIGEYELEFIFVEDGCPDNSGELALAWMAEVAGRKGAVLRQENGGVSAARNAGIELATGEWITMPDSDDFLSANYFARFVELLQSTEFENLNVIANNIHRYFEVNEEKRDDHALQFKFENGNQVIDLELDPHFIQIHVGSTFIKREILAHRQIRFDSRIAASEDAIFLIDVFRASARPKLGINAESIYYYRKRKAADSAVDTFRQRRESYFDRFQLGYLKQFAAVKQGHTEVPRWMMNVVLYEFRWLFEAETSMHLKETVLGENGREEFLDQVSELLAYVSEEAILAYRSSWLGREIRMVLLALKGVVNPDSFVYIKERNHEKGLLRLEYYYTGDLPTERIISGGVVVTPTAAKIQRLNYFGQSVLKMRHLWIPDLGDLWIQLDGKTRKLGTHIIAGTNLAFGAKNIESKFAKSNPETNLQLQEKFRKRRGLRWHLQQAYGEWYAAKYPEKAISGLDREGLYGAQRGILARIRRLAWNQESRAKYAESWVFMDRLGQAQDNAEHLYRWVRENSPKTNIWYVIEEGCPDWSRLRGDGFNLVAYRSLEHYKLMMNAAHFISSHLDYDVVEPIPRRFYINSVRPWKFTFLQHGITKDDMSLWFNQKQIDLLVTTTEAEQRSIVADDSNYKFTDLVTKKTGMPRYDKLARTQSFGGKNTILLAPTWREYLLSAKTGLSAQRELIPNIKETEYFRNWQAVLNDPRLHSLAAERNLEVVFLPHPGLASIVDELQVPKSVRVATYSEGDIQELFVAADIAVTDYSSIAFDLVYAGAKLVYFQFDRATVFAGGHIVRPGYFSYDRDGLGPVAEDVESLFESLHAIAGGIPVEFQERVAELDWRKDGKACERTFLAIKALQE